MSRVSSNARIFVCAALLVLGAACNSRGTVSNSDDEGAKILYGALRDEIEIPVVEIATSLPDGRVSYCTGTIVSTGVVLTASHCAAQSEKSMVIRANAAYSVRSVVSTDLTLDLALLFTDPIDAVPLRIAHGGAAWRGEEFETFGYGRDESNVRGNLRSGDLTVQYLGIDGFGAYHWAGTSGLCFGDSGGPAVVTLNGEYVQIGVNKSISSTTCLDSAVSFFGDLQSAAAAQFLAEHLPAEGFVVVE